MFNEVYSDGIGEITVSGSVVRVDLVSLSPTERDATGKPKAVFRQRLVFSSEAFANSVEIMLKALQGLVDAGAVRRAGPAIEVGDRIEQRSDRPRSENSSPNF